MNSRSKYVPLLRFLLKWSYSSFPDYPTMPQGAATLLPRRGILSKVLHPLSNEIDIKK